MSRNPEGNHKGRKILRNALGVAAIVATGVVGAGKAYDVLKTTPVPKSPEVSAFDERARAAEFARVQAEMKEKLGRAVQDMPLDKDAHIVAVRDGSASLKGAPNHDSTGAFLGLQREKALAGTPTDVLRFGDKISHVGSTSALAQTQYPILERTDKSTNLLAALQEAYRILAENFDDKENPDGVLQPEELAGKLALVVLDSDLVADSKGKFSTKEQREKDMREVADFIGEMRAVGIQVFALSQDQIAQEAEVVQKALSGIIPESREAKDGQVDQWLGPLRAKVYAQFDNYLKQNLGADWSEKNPELADNLNRIHYFGPAALGILATLLAFITLEVSIRRTSGYKNKVEVRKLKKSKENRNWEKMIHENNALASELREAQATLEAKKRGLDQAYDRLPHGYEVDPRVKEKEEELNSAERELDDLIKRIDTVLAEDLDAKLKQPKKADPEVWKAFLAQVKAINDGLKAIPDQKQRDHVRSRTEHSLEELSTAISTLIHEIEALQARRQVLTERENQLDLSLRQQFSRADVDELRRKVDLNRKRIQASGQPIPRMPDFEEFEQHVATYSHVLQSKKAEFRKEFDPRQETVGTYEEFLTAWEGSCAILEERRDFLRQRSTELDQEVQSINALLESIEEEKKRELTGLLEARRALKFNQRTAEFAPTGRETAEEDFLEVLRLIWKEGLNYQGKLLNGPHVADPKHPLEALQGLVKKGNEPFSDELLRRLGMIFVNFPEFPRSIYANPNDNPDIIQYTYVANESDATLNRNPVKEVGKNLVSIPVLNQMFSLLINERLQRVLKQSGSNFNYKTYVQVDFENRNGPRVVDGIGGASIVNKPARITLVFPGNMDHQVARLMKLHVIDMYHEIIRTILYSISDDNHGNTQVDVVSNHHSREHYATPEEENTAGYITAFQDALSLCARSGLEGFTEALTGRPGEGTASGHVTANEQGTPLFTRSPDKIKKITSARNHDRSATLWEMDLDKMDPNSPEDWFQVLYVTMHYAAFRLRNTPNANEEVK